MPAHTAQLTWEPGNGTRYDVLLVTLDKPFMGHQPPAVVLVTNIGKGSMVLTPGGHIHYTYVAEKLRCGHHDASALAELIAPVLNASFGTHESWEERKAEIAAKQGQVAVPG